MTQQWVGAIFVFVKIKSQYNIHQPLSGHPCEHWPATAQQKEMYCSGAFRSSTNPAPYVLPLRYGAALPTSNITPLLSQTTNEARLPLSWFWKTFSSTQF
jgi:hypothetical protein